MNTLLQSIRTVISNLRSNKQVGFASIGSITIALSVFGLFIFLYVNLNSLLMSWSHQVQVIVYLKDDITLKQQINLETLIKQSGEVEEFEYISRQDAWGRFKNMFSENMEFLEGLDFNPLPASYNIHFDRQARRLDRIRKFSERLRLEPGTESVEFGEKWIGRFETFMLFMKLFLVALGTLLSLGAVFIISNTIKLSVFSRKDEIELMLLIGATPAYIKLPYLLEGMIHGLLGALLSLSMIKGLQIFLQSQFQGSLETIMRGIQFQFLSSSFVSSLFLSSLFLGLVGSYISINQFMREYNK